MPSIIVDSNLTTGPKFLDLVARLQVGPRDAYWNLTHLWMWCSHHYPDGVLKDVSDFAIARSAQWPNDPKAFVDALVLSRFVDRVDKCLKLHDWEEWRTEAVRSSARRIMVKRPGFDRNPTSSAQYKDSVVVLSFPVSGKTNDWPLTETLLKDITPLYPGVDVLLECKKALQWIKTNPTRRKTDKGMARFLSGWMDRAQNRSRGGYIPATTDDKTREELNARVDAIIGGRRPTPRV